MLTVMSLCIRFHSSAVQHAEFNVQCSVSFRKLTRINGVVVITVLSQDFSTSIERACQCSACEAFLMSSTSIITHSYSSWHVRSIHSPDESQLDVNLLCAVVQQHHTASRVA